MARIDMARIDIRREGGGTYTVYKNGVASGQIVRHGPVSNPQAQWVVSSGGWSTRALSYAAAKSAIADYLVAQNGYLQSPGGITPEADDRERFGALGWDELMGRVASARDLAIALGEREDIYQISNERRRLLRDVASVLNDEHQIMRGVS